MGLTVILLVWSNRLRARKSVQNVIAQPFVLRCSEPFRPFLPSASGTAPEISDCRREPKTAGKNLIQEALHEKCIAMDSACRSVGQPGAGRWSEGFLCTGHRL